MGLFCGVRCLKGMNSFYISLATQETTRMVLSYHHMEYPRLFDGTRAWRIITHHLAGEERTRMDQIFCKTAENQQKTELSLMGAQLRSSESANSHISSAFNQTRRTRALHRMPPTSYMVFYLKASRGSVNSLDMSER